MMTLPTRMLRHTARLTVPESVTGWHAPEDGRTVTLTKVHVQRSQALGVTGGYSADMEPRPVAELWYDCRISQPHGLDWITLQREADAAGDWLRITYAGGEYRVARVDELQDGAGRPHHYRLELI